MQNTENDGIAPTQLYRLADEERDAVIKCVAIAKQYESIFGLSEPLLIRVARNLGNPYNTSIAPPGSFTPPTQTPVESPQVSSPPVAPPPPPTVQTSLALAKMENAITALKGNIDNELKRATDQQTKDVLTRLRSSLNVVL